MTTVAMPGTLGALHTALCKQRTALQEQVFAEPPHTMEDFKLLLGKYQQLETTIYTVEETMKGLEDD